MEKPCHKQCGVCPYFINLCPGVAAQKSIHLNIIADPCSLLILYRQLTNTCHTARTACPENPLLLRVQIDQILPFHGSRIQSRCSQKSDLLVHSKHSLNGRMLQFIILQNGQLIGYSDPVITAQRSAVRMYHIPLNKKCERVFCKIMGTVWKLLTDHIHMSLQDHHRSILISAGSLLKYNHIPAFILNITKSMLLGKIRKIITDPLRIPRTMGDFCNLLKIMKNSFRFQIL